MSTSATSRRDSKEKDKTKHRHERDKTSRAEREERRERRTPANDGLDGAVAAAAVTSKERHKLPLTSGSPPTGKDYLKTRSATNSPLSPIAKRSASQKRARIAESSDDGADESSVTGANFTNLADAAEKMKKRANIQVESNSFLLNKLIAFDAFKYILVRRPPLLLKKI